MANDTMLQNPEGVGDVTEIHMFLNWIEQICDPDAKLEFPEIFQQMEKNVKIESTTKADTLNNIQFLKSLAGSLAFNKTVRGNGDFLFESYIDKEKAHGFVRKISTEGDLEFFGCFFDGKLHGLCIKSTLGGGFLMSSSTDFTGDDLIYLYPDGLTALVGKFEKGVMKAAHATEVIGIQKTCHEETPFKIPGFSQNVCPCTKILLRPKLPQIRSQEPIFYYDISTEVRISSMPLIQDPYELLFVRVSASTMPFAGEGLFAIDELEPSTVIAFYNGIRIKEDDIIREIDNDVEPDIEDWSCYRLNLTNNVVIDIPKEMSDLKNYSASLGHKISHSFTPNCQFEDYDHPRFGLIKCVVTIAHVLPGEELTANYEYKLADAPSWYKKLWAKHQKRIRKLPDWNSALRSQSAHVNSASLPSSTGSSRTISESRTPDTIPEEDESE